MILLNGNKYRLTKVDFLDGFSKFIYFFENILLEINFRRHVDCKTRIPNALVMMVQFRSSVICFGSGLF